MRWWGSFRGDMHEWKWHPPSWNGLGKVLMPLGSLPFRSHSPTAQLGPSVWISLADSWFVSRHSISTFSNPFYILRSYLCSLYSSWVIAGSCSKNVNGSFIQQILSTYCVEPDTVLSFVHSGCPVTQLCLILCDPMDCSPLGSSVHGISQARILEWVVISFFRASSQPRD